MLRNMTIGQFYNVDSVLHRLDPRVKLSIAFFYIITLFLDKNLVLFAVAICALMVQIGLSKVPVQFLFRGMKTLGGFILLTGALNVITVRGAKVIWEWGIISVTEAGVNAAVYTSLRLLLMVIASSMMTYTTSATSLTDGLEKMFGWLRVFGVPVHELAMVMSIAIRFVPVLVEELDRIMKAQMARGVDFQEGNLFTRVKKLLPIVVPLLASSIRRSQELALAMDARGYHGGDGRTKMRPLRYQRRDIVAYLVLFIYILITVMVTIVF